MNQEDLAARPMYSAFQSKPNFAPFNALPNQIPLTLGVPGYSSSLTQATAARAAGARAMSVKPPAVVPVSERAIYASWAAWSRHQHFVGRHAIEDYAKPALLNRLDWYSAHNWRLAYPGRRSNLRAKPSTRAKPAGRPPRRRITQHSHDPIPTRRGSHPRRVGAASPDGNAPGIWQWPGDTDTTSRRSAGSGSRSLSFALAHRRATACSCQSVRATDALVPLDIGPEALLLTYMKPWAEHNDEKCDSHVLASRMR